MTRVLILITFIFLSACSYYSAGIESRELNKLSVGMSKEQVIAALGPPSRTQANESYEKLVYVLTDSYSYASTVITAGLLPPVKKKSEYVVVLKNGIVESFGNRDVGQPSMAQ